MKIIEMLEYRRPAGGKTEAAFIERFILPHQPQIMERNLIVTVPGGSGRTLFSCHTDTVHHNEGKQEVVYDPDMGWAYKRDSQALGADNGAGVWLLLEMIEAKIPGTYIFHYGEERGCIGSHAMAEKQQPWLRQFDRAIAFDRRGESSIITHQMGGTRCCSEDFGLALAAQLNKTKGFAYKLDDTGLVTDTAHYRYEIAECVNVSVGYYDEHGGKEALNVEHLLDLAGAVLQVNWDDLPVKRNRRIIESRHSHGGGVSDHFFARSQGSPTQYGQYSQPVSRPGYSGLQPSYHSPLNRQGNPAVVGNGRVRVKATPEGGTAVIPLRPGLVDQKGNIKTYDHDGEDDVYADDYDVRDNHWKKDKLKAVVPDSLPANAEWYDEIDVDNMSKETGARLIDMAWNNLETWDDVYAMVRGEPELAAKILLAFTLSEQMAFAEDLADAMNNEADDDRIDPPDPVGVMTDDSEEATAVVDLAVPVHTTH